MSFVCYLFSVAILLNVCLGQQLCIDSCKFEQPFEQNFTLPSNCTSSQQTECSVVLTFDYTTRVVTIEFGFSQTDRHSEPITYTSDNIAYTTFTLNDNSSVQHTIEYYCSTGDRCDFNYVRDQALALYTHKHCANFREQLSSLLYANPPTSTRQCMSKTSNVSSCDRPCVLSFINPTDTLRICEGEQYLGFRTAVGRSTPESKPEYNYRLYAYSCTTPVCNGYDTQARVEKLIDSDNGDCLITLKPTWWWRKKLFSLILFICSNIKHSSVFHV